MLLDARTRSQVLDYMPKPEVVEKLVGFFDVFSDYTRLKIVSALLVSSMCVTDLAELLGLNQTTVSHQLRQLKQIGAVRSKRQGKVVFYSVENPKVGEMMLNGVEYLGF